MLRDAFSLFHCALFKSPLNLEISKSANILATVTSPRHIAMRRNHQGPHGPNETYLWISLKLEENPCFTKVWLDYHGRNQIPTFVTSRTEKTLHGTS
jgi:hypothetical protein